MTPPVLGEMAMRRFGTITLEMVTVFILTPLMAAQEDGVFFTGKAKPAL
jgi:hypothetical protein